MSETSDKKNSSLRGDIYFLLAKILVLAVIITVMFTVIFGFVRVNDMSMKPSVMEGDLILYYRMQKKYNCGDLLVLNGKGNLQVRRVVAVAGDTVDITEDGLKVNGNIQQESNIYTATEAFMEGITFPVTLSDGEIFVLGDKRDTAEDSRIYGAVKESATKGKVVSILRRRNF